MVAIDLIVQHVHSQLEEVSHGTLRGWRHLVAEPLLLHLSLPPFDLI